MNQDKFKSIVTSAIDREQEAFELYTKLANHSEQQNVVQFFTEMANEEKKHKQLLQDFLQHTPMPELKEEEVPNLQISEYMDEKPYDNNMSYQDALVMAMKKEEQARDLYKTLADTNLDPEAQKLFNFLSQQEAKHKLTIEKEYDDAILAED